MSDYKNKLILGDFFEIEKEISDDIFNLLILDWPYNLGKAEWDIISSPIEFYGKVLKIAERTLKSNGSLYLFHNDFRIIRDISLWIEKNTELEFKQLIIWNKRFKTSRNNGYLNGYLEVENLRNYQKMCEYILYYTFNNFHKIEERRKELNLTQRVISEEVRSRNGNLTGWLSNIEKGLNYPNQEHIDAIKKHLGIDLNDFIPTFNNQKTHHSVWNYDIAERLGHITPKPLSLIENIILHSSNKGDLVGDFFCGSGTTLVACKKSGRYYFGIEKEKKYYDIAIKRLNSTHIYKNISNFTRKESNIDWRCLK